MDTRGGSLPGAERARQRSVRLGLLGAVLVLLSAGTFNLLTVKPFFAGDESAHANYALELATGRLPHFDDRFPGRMPDMIDTPTWTAQHPPLYYALVAAPLHLGLERGAPHAGLRWARLVTLLLAILAVLLTGALAAELVPGRPAVVVASAAGLALVPSFQQVAALVYNDALAVLTTVAVLLVAVRTVRRGSTWSRLLLLALGGAAAAATRASGLEVAGLAGLAALTPWAGRPPTRWSREWAPALARGAVVAGAVAAASGWFYLRNLELYGSIDGSTKAISPTGPRGLPVLDYVTSMGFWLDMYRQVYGFVISNLQLPPALRLLAHMLLAVVVAGLVLALVRRLRQGWSPTVAGLRGPIGRAWALAGVHAALSIGAVLVFFSRGGITFGRYFFSLLPLLPVVAAVGLAALPGRRRGWPTLAALVSVAGIGVTMTVLVLAGIPPAPASRPVPGAVGQWPRAGGPPARLVLSALVAVYAAGLGLVIWAVSRLSGCPSSAGPPSR